MASISIHQYLELCVNASASLVREPVPNAAGTPLSPHALLFRTLLEDSQVLPPLAARFPPAAPGAWGVLVEPGAEEEGTLAARFFQDSTSFCGGTSLGSAGVPQGVCTLTLRVVGGAALGVAAPTGAGCPSGFSEGRPSPGAAPACRACAPGHEPAAGVAGGCTPCVGVSFKPFWGDAACEPCSDPDPAHLDAYPAVAGDAAYKCSDERGGAPGPSAERRTAADASDC